MMPILRKFSKDVVRGMSPVLGVLPAVMYEGSVGLRHAMRIFAALDRSALAVSGVEQLAGQLLVHRAATAGARRAHQPAHGQRDAALGPNVHRHLVRGATDAARLDLDGRCGVSQRLVEDVDGWAVR